MEHSSPRKKFNRQHNAKQSALRSMPVHPDRTIEWFGGVNYENLEHVISEIKRMMTEDAQEEIYLIVNSYGGPTGIAMSFFDTVRSLLKPNLVTIGSGDVDSSGIIVFLAGTKRYLTKNTTLLFHLAGRTFEPGKRFTTYDMEAMMKEDKLKDYQYACVVSDVTQGHYSPEKILDMMAKNTIMSASEATNLGLADTVIE